MNAEEILQYCLDNLKGVVMVESWGERGIYYNPEASRPSRRDSWWGGSTACSPMSPGTM